MSLFRRFQAPVVALLLGALAVPPVAACCAWASVEMPCCEKSDDAGLAAPCCMSEAEGAPQRQLATAAAQLPRVDAGLTVASVAQPVMFAAAGIEAAFDQFNGPPGSERLYLRLSVIRR